MSNSELLEKLKAGQPRRRWGRLVIAALLLGGAFMWYQYSKGNAQQAVRYETAEIKKGDLSVTVAASGTLEPTNVVTVGSELSGIVASVLVDINDKVKKGDLLAQLDPSKLDDAITKSQAALTSAQAGVAQAQATLTQSKASLDRLRELDKITKGRLPAKADMDAAIADHAKAQANVASAQASVEQAQAQLSSDKTNLEKASIRSPIDGLVLSRSVDAGQTVAASLSAPTLFEIAEDLGKMELNVAVDEADVGQVKDGQEAVFTVDAYPGRTYPAKVTRVSYGSTKTDNVVTYTTTLEVDNADLSLRPGMTASATISTQTRDDVLLVPAAALRFTPPATASQSQGGIVSSLMPRMPRMGGQRARGGSAGSQSVLWVLENGQPSRVEITRGLTNGSQTEVSGEGLAAGQKVITGSNAP